MPEKKSVSVEDLPHVKEANALAAFYRGPLIEIPNKKKHDLCFCPACGAGNKVPKKEADTGKKDKKTEIECRSCNYVFDVNPSGASSKLKNE